MPCSIQGCSRQLRRHPRKLLHQLCVPLYINARYFAFHEERPARFQYAASELVETRRALPVRDGEQFRFRQQLLRYCGAIDLSVLDEHRWLALQYLIQPPMPEEEPYDHIVHREQGERADQAACYRIVLTNDRILHGVRQGQQHNEIKRIQLRQFTFAKDAQRHDQKAIDDQRAYHLLGDGKREPKHILRKQ